MNEKEHDHNWQQGLDHIKNQSVHVPNWKRIHHTWIFWIFLLLMLAAITYYVISADFAFAPQNQPKQPAGNNIVP